MLVPHLIRRRILSCRNRRRVVCCRDGLGILQAMQTGFLVADLSILHYDDEDDDDDAALGLLYLSFPESNGR